jgi:transcriptional regulator with XRE-family HTH domain
MSQIGQRIKKVRKELKLSQLDFAESLGIDQSHVSKLEKGVSEPSEMLVIHIANSYEVNLNWLREGTGIMWWSPELTLKEMKKLREKFGDEAQTGLLNLFQFYIDLLDYMFLQVHKLIKLDINLNEPEIEIINAKKELEDSLFALRHEIEVLFEPKKKEDKGGCSSF